MSNTPPPSFPMENLKDQLRGYANRLYVKNLLKKVFPQEAFSDSRTIGGFFWCPHNYRLKVPFSGFLDFDSTPICNTGSLSRFPVHRSRKKIISIKVNSFITVQIFKSCAMIIYSERSKGGAKLWRKVSITSLEGFNSLWDAEQVNISQECFNALKGLELPLNFNFEGALFMRHEDAVKGESFLDSIPKDQVIEDTTFKKVYKDEVEFKNPFFLKNYINSRVTETLGDYEPRIKALEIAQENKGGQVPPFNAPWLVWADYFFNNREALGLDYSRVRWLT